MDRLQDSLHPKKDPKAEAAFRVTLADQMEKLDLPAGIPVRLWGYDEMRYGLHPLTRKMWCLRGIRAIAPSRIRYQNGYLYGALEVGGSGSEFLFTPTLNKEWDLGFLGQIAAHDPDSIHVVIGDGAGFHHKKGEEALPEKIRIITLPAYSPKLNPVEKLWDIVKDGICNRDWADGVFCEIIVELDLAVHEAGFEVRQLIGGVGQGVAQLASGA